MNIRKEITDIVLNKYGHTILDPLSIKTQMGKLWEEFEELKKANTVEQVECEIGDVLFVEKTLQILLDNYIDETIYVNKQLEISEIVKGLNKCDRDVVYPLYRHINDIIIENEDKCSNIACTDELLERTIIKNQGRSGKTINGCYIKSEDIK